MTFSFVCRLNRERLLTSGHKDTLASPSVRWYGTTYRTIYRIDQTNTDQRVVTSEVKATKKHYHISQTNKKKSKEKQRSFKKL
jgi:hypothetical protein